MDKYTTLSYINAIKEEVGDLEHEVSKPPVFIPNNEVLNALEITAQQLIDSGNNILKVVEHKRKKYL